MVFKQFDQSPNHMQEFYIKNMVCNRCKLVVTDIFKKFSTDDLIVELGKVITSATFSAEQLTELNNQLEAVGFEMIDDNKSRLIENIKKSIIELVHYPEGIIKVNFSVYLENKLAKDYNYLSSLFSEVEGYTIEKYLINQKIEKVKELLVYRQLTLSEIAYEMGYSNVSHLSSQFKKVTGITPSQFKQMGDGKRKPIDLV